MARHDSHEMWGQKWKISLMPHKINSDTPVVVVSFMSWQARKETFSIIEFNYWVSKAFWDRFVFALPLLYDWFRKLAPLYQPIKCKTKLNNTMVNLVSYFIQFTCLVLVFIHPFWFVPQFWSVFNTQSK